MKGYAGTKRTFYDPSANQSLDCRWTIAASKPDVPTSGRHRVHARRTVVSCRAAELRRDGGMKCNLELNRSDYATIHSVAAASRCRQRRVMMSSAQPRNQIYLSISIYLLGLSKINTNMFI